MKAPSTKECIAEQNRGAHGHVAGEYDCAAVPEGWHGQTMLNGFLVARPARAMWHDHAKLFLGCTAVRPPCLFN